MKIASFGQILWAPNHNGHTNAIRSLLRRINRQTSSRAVIAMSNESANTKQGGHCYVERIGKHQARRSLIRQPNWRTSSTTDIATSNELTNIIATPNESLRRQRKAALCAKYVFIRIGPFERTSRTRTQKLLYTQNTYSYTQDA